MADFQAALRSDLLIKDAIMLQKLRSNFFKGFVIILKHQWYWSKPKYFSVFKTMKVCAEYAMQKYDQIFYFLFQILALSSFSLVVHFFF